MLMDKSKSTSTALAFEKSENHAYYERIGISNEEPTKQLDTQFHEI